MDRTTELKRSLEDELLAYSPIPIRSSDGVVTVQGDALNLSHYRTPIILTDDDLALLDESDIVKSSDGISHLSEVSVEKIIEQQSVPKDVSGLTSNHEIHSSETSAPMTNPKLSESLINTSKMTIIPSQPSAINNPESNEKVPVAGRRNSLSALFQGLNNLIGNANTQPITPQFAGTLQTPLFSPIIAQLQTGSSKITDAVASLLPAWSSRRKSIADAAGPHISEEEEEDVVNAFDPSSSLVGSATMADDNLALMFQQITVEDKKSNEVFFSPNREDFRASSDPLQCKLSTNLLDAQCSFRADTSSVSISSSHYSDAMESIIEIPVSTTNPTSDNNDDDERSQLNSTPTLPMLPVKEEAEESSDSHLSVTPVSNSLKVDCQPLKSVSDRTKEVNALQSPSCIGFNLTTNHPCDANGEIHVLIKDQEPPTTVDVNVPFKYVSEDEDNSNYVLPLPPYEASMEYNSDIKKVQDQSPPYVYITEKNKSEIPVSISIVKLAETENKQNVFNVSVVKDQESNNNIQIEAAIQEDNLPLKYEDKNQDKSPASIKFEKETKCVNEKANELVSHCIAESQSLSAVMIQSHTKEVAACSDTVKGEEICAHNLNHKIFDENSANMMNLEDLTNQLASIQVTQESSSLERSEFGTRSNDDWNLSEASSSSSRTATVMVNPIVPSTPVRPIIVTTCSRKSQGSTAKQKRRKSSLSKRRGTITLESPVLLNSMHRFTEADSLDISSCRDSTKGHQNSLTLRQIARHSVGDNKENQLPKPSNMRLSSDSVTGGHRSSIRNQNVRKSMPLGSPINSTILRSQQINVEVVETEKHSVNGEEELEVEVPYNRLSNRMKTKEVEEEKRQLRAKIEELNCNAESLERVVSAYQETFEAAIDQKAEAYLAMGMAAAQADAELYDAQKQVVTVHQAIQDSYRRVLKMQETIEENKLNQENLIKVAELYRNKCMRTLQKGEAYQEYCLKRIKRGLEQQQESRTTIEKEVSKIRVQEKQIELKIASLESQLTQKTQENQELTRICDSLLG